MEGKIETEEGFRYVTVYLYALKQGANGRYSISSDGSGVFAMEIADPYYYDFEDTGANYYAQKYGTNIPLPDMEADYYTLYTRDGDIYYTNSEEEKVFLSFDEEVGSYLGEDYFFKLVAANLDNSLLGKFVDEETGTTIDVKASYVTVTPLEGEATRYDIYEKDGSYFIIYENEIK